MLLHPLRIFNFDDSLLQQHNLIEQFKPDFDHPRNFSARDKFREYINDTNEHTNILLLEALLD